MPANYIDVTGQRFGKLIVIERVGSIYNRQARWLCRCDCGKTWTGGSSTLRRGEARSCGCMTGGRTHGMSRGHPLYEVWKRLRQRVSNPKTKDYDRYGGRGIAVCEEWQSFKAFYDWAITNGYQPGLSIDRYPDKDGHYSPDNCRWATAKQQANNRHSRWEIARAALEAKP